MSGSVGQYTKKITGEFESAGIESARLDSLILVEDVTGKNRAHLLAHPELQLTDEQINQLDSMIQRRMRHEPLAYIRGKVEFYGREFTVNEHVLVPRPESESFLEVLGRFGDLPTIIDVGTGSGALAISAALERPGSSVIGIDIDDNCLAVAAKNAKALHAQLKFQNGDLLRSINLDELAGPVTILANLPYVPNEFAINKSATHEPELALFGGPDGLDLYRVMFDQFDQFEDQTFIVLTESLESQHQSLAGIAKNHGFVAGTSIGLVQSFTRILE